MGWTSRHLCADDSTELAAFSCESGLPCGTCSPGGGNKHEAEVGEYLRSVAIDALARRTEADHRLIAIHDPTATIAAVGAHEIYELVLGDEEIPARLLFVAAIRSDLHGAAIGDLRLSSQLIAELVHDFATDDVEFVWARVAPCNLRSIGLLKRHGLTTEISPSGDGYRRFVGELGGVLATLPPALAVGT